MATTNNSTQPKNYIISAVEYDSILEQLKELTHDFISAWASQDGFPGEFGEALIKLHAVRGNVETAAVAVQP